MQRVKRVSFDGNSGDHSLQSLPSIAGTEDTQLAPTPLPDAAQMDEVSPLIRSIFEGRKKLVDSSSHNVKRDLGGANAQSKNAPQKEKELVMREYEETMRKKVDALEEEITIFKNESKRLKKVAKEHEDALRRLAQERAEWEQQKKTEIQAFQAQQEEQTEKLKKEKKLLEYKSMSLGLPAVQRKEADELKATLAKQTEEHNGKEKRLRLTITRLRAMNEDLTRQVLEMREEIQRYESCLLADLDGRDNGWQVKADCKKPCGDANHKLIHPKYVPDEATREKRSRGHPSTEENYDSSTPRGSEHMRTKTTSSLLCEQASLLSDLFKRPWKATCDYEKPSSRCGSDLAGWR